MVPLPGSDGLLLTGTLSPATHPWLADHAVQGTVLLPGTGFVELVAHAATTAGCHTIDELIIETLLLPTTNPVQLSVTVGEPNPDGHRTVTTHTHTHANIPNTPENPTTPGTWTRHVTATISPSNSSAPPPETPVWPPQNTQPVDVTDFYDELATIGYEYGPAFQGLQAAWRDHDTVYAEITLAEEQAEEAGRFTIHPALLDAALHASVLHASDTGQEVRLPFSWNRVEFHATGAAVLRVALTPVDDGWSVRIADDAGRPVATIGSLATRPLATDSTSSDLFAVSWTEVPAPGQSSLDAAWFDDLAQDGGAVVPEVVVHTALCTPGEDPLTAARTLTTQVLRTVQQWLTDERFADSTLVLHTSTDLAGRRCRA